LCHTLEATGYTTTGYTSPAKAIAAFRAGEHDLLLTDLTMPEMDGIALIAAVKAIDPQIGAIVMTGNGTIDTAVLAMQGGALDYILKPFQLKVILPVIARALDLQRLRRENAALNQREQRRSEELADAYQQLESFSYSISHDLRAPLQFVKGFAGMLEDQYAEQLGEEGVRMLHVIRDGSRSMDEMIVGLLAFSRAGVQPLRKTQLDMTAIARSALVNCLSTYEGPAARVDIEPLPPAAGDSTVISHAWSNLIGNALKYSALRAEPRISITGRIEGDESIYRVEDNGAGFDMAYADKLFGVFKRLHSAQDYPGTGVGLAIVQRIVTRHGGWIRGEGQPDVGACFEFALPTAAAAQESEAVQA
jgi:two-component system sensor histidine kinase/response regulator